MCPHVSPWPASPVQLAIYDPKVTSEQIFRDISTPKFEWDRPDYSRSHSRILDNIKVRIGASVGSLLLPDCK